MQGEFAQEHHWPGAEQVTRPPDPLGAAAAAAACQRASGPSERTATQVTDAAAFTRAWAATKMQAKVCRKRSREKDKAATKPQVWVRGLELARRSSWVSN